MTYFPYPYGPPNNPMFPYNQPTGWVCPKCSRVYSPDTPQCWSCNGPLHFGGGIGGIVNPDGTGTAGNPIPPGGTT